MGESFCYLLGGQVRDLLKGKISSDVDFNYACSAQDVARVCVENEWPVKFKAIGPVSKPNYVLIGDEQSEQYLEGFSISFNATLECFNQDFRQNLLFYDLANHIILDKSGFGMQDIRNCELRLSCAPSKNFDDWASADMTTGQKALRYVKFIVRSQLRRSPLKFDSEESAFVVSLLRRAFRENGAALKQFWFGYVLGECLTTQQGVETLFRWVCDQGGSSWWEEWIPFVRPKVGDERWLNSLSADVSPQSMASTIKEVFGGINSEGLIAQEDLKTVMRKLGAGFSEKEFELLFAGSYSAHIPGKLNLNDFIDQVVFP